MTLSDNGASTSGESGVGHHKCTELTLVYDHDTCLVSLGIKDVAVGLAQMMVDEAARQLAEIRRMAAAQQLLQQRRDADQAAAIAASLTKR